jgi:hypothetical protein
MNKNCKHCNAEFVDESRTQTALFCHKTCKNTYWYLNNKEYSIERSRAYEAINKDKVKERKRKYVNKRRSEDLSFRLAANIRARISRAVTHNFKHSSLSGYLGCTIEELKTYLESKFQLGMTWDNYGEWEIDHIYPLAKSDLTNPDIFAKVCNYTNLQPLWALENKIKKDSI